MMFLHDLAKIDELAKLGELAYTRGFLTSWWNLRSWRNSTSWRRICQRYRRNLDLVRKISRVKELSPESIQQYIKINKTKPIRLFNHIKQRIKDTKNNRCT